MTHSKPATTRLAIELALLYRVEAAHKIPAAPVANQLVVHEQQPLPDVLPPKPAWVEFEWPVSGTVDLNAYWSSVDREKGKLPADRWREPYL